MMIFLTMLPMMMKIDKTFDMSNKYVTDSCDILIHCVFVRMPIFRLSLMILKFSAFLAPNYS